MSASSLTQLKMIVERVVRPVRATMVRKRRMREELLAHVSAVFAQERAKVGDDAAALARTAARFGDAQELSRDLQQSVPWIDRMARLAGPPFWLRRPGESRGRFAVRQCLQLGIFLSWAGIGGSLLLYGLLFLVSASIRQSLLQVRDLALVLTGAGIGLVALILIASVVIFLVHGMIHALYGPRGRSWPLILLLGGVMSLINVSIPLALFGLGQLDARTTLPELLATLPGAAVGGPALLICIASVCHRMTDGPVGWSWRRIGRLYAGGCLIVAGATFIAVLALSGDALLGSENTLKILLILSSWIIPLELAVASPRIVARIRADREWANLLLD
jgi:hypothetical protein